MSTPHQQPVAASQVRCVVCETYARPLYVPWQQHALGCAVRAAQLEQAVLESPGLPSAA